MDFNIFISYSTLDLKHVNAIKSILDTTPIRVFIAEHDIQSGDELTATISDAINKCDLFLVLLSKNSNNSNWVQQEIGKANTLGKQIVPMVLDDEAVPEGFISDLKYIRVYENQEKALNQAKVIAEDAYAKKVEKHKSSVTSNNNGLVGVGLGALFLWAVTR